MSLSSRAAFQAAVYGVEQHILCEKKCRYKPLPLPDTEEHILHSPVKILTLLTHLVLTGNNTRRYAL